MGFESDVQIREKIFYDGCTADNDQLGYRVLAMARWF